MKQLILKNPLIVITCFCIIFFSCEKKSELINITIKVVDSETKKPRINDTVEVCVGKPSFPMREYHLIRKTLTDSAGETKITIPKDEIYSIMAWGNHTFGSTEFKKGALENNSVVTLQIVPPEKRKIKI